MINQILIKHSYSFNYKLLKYTFNQISTNEVLDIKSTNKIYCLNNCLYAPTNNQNKSFYNKTIRINHLPIKAFNKTYNKTFIPYNHFKGFKRDFNYNLYKSIKLMRFWLVDRLKCFKIDINKIVRLKIYKWGLVKILLLISTNKIFEIIMDFNKIILKMILISSFGWSRIWIEFIPDKFIKDCELSEILGVFSILFQNGQKSLYCAKS